MADTEALADTRSLHQAGTDPTGIPGKREACSSDVRDDHWRYLGILQPGVAHFIRWLPTEALESRTVEENIEPSVDAQS